MDADDKTIEKLQGWFQSFRRVLDIVGSYSEKNYKGMLDGVTIDYANPEHEFYVRIMSGIAQEITHIEMITNYLVKPVRKSGTLLFDYSAGKYKVGDEYINADDIIEYQTKGKWELGRLCRDPGDRLKYFLRDMDAKDCDVELKGLNVRLR